MNKDKRNNIQLLGTLNNADESGIIANANQIYDSVAQKSVEERITDLDNKIESQAAVINKPDNEDLEQTKDSDGNDVLRFKDNEYEPTVFSGLGRKYLRKNIVNTYKTHLEDITSSITKTSNKYIDLSNGVGNKYTIGSAPNLSYLSIVCKANESYIITAKYKSKFGTYFWALVDSNNNILKCGGTGSDNNTELRCIVTTNVDCTLLVNIITELNHEYTVEKVNKADTKVLINLISDRYFSDSNTIYVIKYDYDLNNSVIELPENSCLYFDGGSINNGTIVGNNSSVQCTGNYNIFGNTIIKGTWTISDWYAEWFGAKGDGITDDTEAVQRLLKISNSVINIRINCILVKKYLVTKGLFMYPNSSIDGKRHGKIIAKFENPLDWILQNWLPVIDTRKVDTYNTYIEWRDFDRGTHLNWSTSDRTIIQNINIQGTLGNDKKPIYGGLRLTACYVNTYNVEISNVGIGLYRSCAIKTSDNEDNITAYYYGFCGSSLNGISLKDCYINTDIYTSTNYDENYRYRAVYGQNSKAVDQYTDTNGNLISPGIAICIYAYSSEILLENIITDLAKAGVALIGGNCTLTDINHHLEGIKNCILYNYASDLLIIQPYLSSSATYDCSIDAGRIYYILPNGNKNIGKGNVDKSGKGQYFNHVGSLYVIPYNFNSIYPYGDNVNILGAPNKINLLPSDSTQTSSDKYNILPRNAGDSTSIVYGDSRNYYVEKNKTVNFNLNYQTLAHDIYVYGSTGNRASILSCLGIKSATYLAGSRCLVFSSLTIINAEIPVCFGDNRICFVQSDVKIKRNFIKEMPASNIYVAFLTCIVYSDITGRSIFKNDIEAANSKYIVEINKDTILSPLIRLAYITKDDKTLDVDIVSFRHSGLTSYRNSISWHLSDNYIYYNRDTNRYEFYNGHYWGDINGNAFYTKSGTTDEYPTTIGIPTGSIFYDTTLAKNVTLLTQGRESFFKIIFNNKITDGILQNSNGTTITAGKIHVVFNNIELDMVLTEQDILFAQYESTCNNCLSHWCAKKWMEAGYYAYVIGNIAFLSDMKCGSAEIGTCTDVSGNETNLSFKLEVQKGTANVWE